MILPQLLTLCSSLSLSLRVFICVCILSLWVRYVTVSRTCVSCRTPSRDSTRVTATADSANWRTCCKTLWYVLRFCPTLASKGFFFDDQHRTSGGNYSHAVHVSSYPLPSDLWYPLLCKSSLWSFH